MILVKVFARSCVALAVVAAGAVSVHGAVASKDDTEKGAGPRNLRMVDARVNLKDALERSVAARPQAAAAGVAATRQAAAIGEAIARLSRTLPGLEVKRSGLTGGPESVRNKRGALTDAARARASVDIVRDFLLRHGAIYGLSAADVDDLVVLGDSPGGKSGLRMLRMEQQIDGRPIFQSETRFLLDRQGRLTKTLGRMVPRARSFAPSGTGRLDAVEALVRLLDASGHKAEAGSFAAGDENAGRLELAETDELVAGPVTARQVLFPLAPGLLVPAWSLVVFTNGDADWYAVVDADTGDLLWRKNIRNQASTHDARFRVYVQADGITPADNPAPHSPTSVAPGSGQQFPEILPTIVSMHVAMDAAASPNGWIEDCPGGVCTANETQTLGNNVLACLDRAAPANVCDTDAGGVLDGNGRPTGNPDTNSRNRDFLGTAPRDFQTNYLPPPQGGNPEAGQTATGAGSSGTAAVDQFRRGAVTDLFYMSNWYHDKLFALGFDEAAGNFQQINFSGMGVGNDRVLADAQDNAGVNNANFATPPDGISGRMQMFRFTGPTIDRDGGLDAEIVFHELTHGTSNRLVGNGAGLNWDQAVGMGEGWSDFYALALLNNTNADNPEASYAEGGYATYKLSVGFLDNYLYGIRRFPYTADNSVNPMTWADVDDVTNDLSGGIPPSPINFNDNGGLQVHNAGGVWALTLWEVRSRIIADPDGADGDVPTGNQTTLQLVTDGLKLTPIDPSFTDARDAILDADCDTNACANEDSIWGGFADRGLGYGASTPYNVIFGYTAGHMGVRESFNTPFLDVVDPPSDVAIANVVGNGDSVIDPGEVLAITATLTNPWRAASKAVITATATLTTSTPGISIVDDTSTYGPIAPQGTATGDPFVIAVAPAVPCGSRISFTLTVTSNLGTTVTSFTLRVGAANGTDPVVTYTNATSLSIPDNRPRAVFNTLTITDDREIADLDFRVNSVTHTFPGDLTVMLRSPGATGVDLVSLIGGLIAGGGDGDHIANMLINDDLPFTNDNDMVQAANAAAPYTGDWLPVFNAPWPPLAGFPSPDPVGNLSRFDGTSTQGTWSVAASDQFAVDAGTLNSWSMLVTPVHFACTDGGPTGATVTATKTVAGSFREGGTVTYTVTLSNSGSGAQFDNPGNEFADVVPAGLTVVGTSASAGTAANVGNSVTWNGAVAPAVPVTITITATVNGGTEGALISNQGTAGVDTDGNGTNETAVLTDDPAVGGPADPTVFQVSWEENDFFTVVPCRVVDTRLAGPPLAAGSDRQFTIVGVCGIPATAKAVALNLAVTLSTAAGHIRMHAAGTPPPAVVSLNYSAGQTRSNNAIVSLNPNGALAAFASQASGTVELILDVYGYFE